LHSLANLLVNECWPPANDWLENDSWPPTNSRDLGYHASGAVLDECNDLNPQQQDVAELKVALQTILDNLFHETTANVFFELS